MGYVRSHTFCFCIPVRFGVFILSTIFLLGGGTMAGFCWYGAVHKKHARLTKNHEISIVIVSILYTVLAIVSLFGLIGTIIKRRTFVAMYRSIISLHLGFSIATGAYFIYTLFHKVGEEDVNNCIANNMRNHLKAKDCKKQFEITRAMVIGLFIVFWLFELWCCLIVADYVSELKEEDVPDYPPPAEIAASLPPLATTYNYTSRYPFSTPESSFGQRNTANV